MKWLLVGLLFATGSAAMSSEVHGTVRHIRVRASDGLHYIEMNGVPTARPACAAASIYYMIRDEGSNAGKSQLAMLLSAYHANTPVRIYGAGSCARWSDGEDIDSVALVR